MRFVALGHSHISKFQQGYASLKNAGALPVDLSATFIDAREFRPLFRRNEMNKALAAKVDAAVAESPEPHATAVISILSGNQLPRYALVEPPVPYDFVLPFEQDLPVQPSVQILHYQALYEMLSHRVREVLGVLRALKLSYDGPVVQVEHPPAIPDNDYLRSLFGRQSMLTDVPLMAASTRAKWWRLHSRIFSDHCSEIGVTYIRLPPDVVTSEGYLVREAWGSDPFHANEWYGERVFAHVQDTIRRLLAD